MEEKIMKLLLEEKKALSIHSIAAKLGTSELDTLSEILKLMKKGKVKQRHFPLGIVEKDCSVFYETRLN